MSASAAQRLASIEDAPLTFQQQFFWDYFDLAAGEYRLSVYALRLYGPLNVDLLGTCFDQIVRRYDALRTRIVLRNGAPRQCVDDATGFELELLRFGAAPGGEARARDFIARFCSRKCDLAAGPLFEVKLIELSENDHVLVWGIHHIIFDIPTLKIVLSEVWQLYADALHGRVASLGAPPMRYIDYAIQQRETADEWMQRHQEYWKDRLSRFACARWPSENGVISSGCWTGSSHPMSFPVGVRTDLRKLAQWARTTLSNTLLTLYAAAVASWCDQHAITVPVNVLGRHAPEYDRIVGYFAHFLYVHVELSANETFGGLLAKVTRDVREGLAHQDFGRVSANAPEVLTGGLFSWIPYSEGDWLAFPTRLSAETGIDGQEFPFQRVANGPYELHGIGAIFFEANRDFTGYLWYPNTFSLNDVERFALHFQNVAQRAASNPNAPLL